MSLTVFLASAAVFTAVVYYYLTWNYDYWEKRSVKFVKPIPFFGNYFNSMLARSYNGDEVTKKAKQFPNEKVVGMFIGRRPVLYVRDPELIKDITVKDFWYFANRFANFEKESQIQTLDSNMFAARQETWKVLRKSYSPMFSSASLKKIFSIIDDTCKQFEQYMISLAGKEVNFHSETSKLTMEIIGATVFGLQVNNVNDEVNVFRTMGQRVIMTTKLTVFSWFCRTGIPQLMKLINLQGRDVIAFQYVDKLTRKAIDMRKSENKERHDFIDTAIRLLKKETLQDEVNDVTSRSSKTVQIPVTLDLLVAQSFVFLGAGFETSATAMTFTLYELAKKPEVQKKAQKEIDDALKSTNGNLTYESVMDLTYLNMCMSETMRMHPAIGAIFRVCDAKYTFKDINVTIDPGVMVLLPAQELHYDPKYFPNPDEYDPERFSPENKEKINPYAYIPFGVGYRNCIGLRLGVLQTLMGLVTFLKNYNIEPTERTPKKVTISPMSTVVSVPGVPIYLRIVPRK